MFNPVNQEEEDEDSLYCGCMVLFGFVEANQACKALRSTLRLESKVKGVSVLVLINNDSSHNIISFMHTWCQLLKL